MKCIVIYSGSATFQIDIPTECQHSLNSILNYMFKATNPDSGDETIIKLNEQGAKLPSASVGDLFIVNDNYYFVDNFGFAMIDMITAIKAQHLGYRETIMGYTWLMNHHNFPPILNHIH